MPEQHVDGTSFVSLLRGRDSMNRGAVYWHFPHYGNQGGTPFSSIRLGDYKLIEFFEDGHLELYNLKEDIEEKCDLSSKMPEQAQKMYEMLSEWRKIIEAKIPETNQEWK